MTHKSRVATALFVMSLTIGSIAGAETVTVLVRRICDRGPIHRRLARPR